MVPFNSPVVVSEGVLSFWESYLYWSTPLFFGITVQYVLSSDMISDQGWCPLMVEWYVHWLCPLMACDAFSDDASIGWVMW